MLGLAFAFLIFALVAGAYGLGGLASASAGAAQFVFMMFLILSVGILVLRIIRRSESLAERCAEPDRARSGS